MHLVPFDSSWAGSETKLDIKGIYARGGDPTSLTSPLPLRRHLDWSRKGFTFISLSSLEELGLVAQSLRANGHDPQSMRDCFDQNGQFNVKAYLAEVSVTSADRVADLQAKVDRYGAEAVLDLMRVSDPSFTFPPEVRLTSDQASEPVAEEPDAPKTTRPKKEKAAPAPSEPVGLVGAFKG